nr:cytochrome oxidase subunit II, mitochondrial [Tanacetum cinerariifolium]
MAFPKEKIPIPQRIVHGTIIEILRTIFPSIIPIFIVIPSFSLLYSMDEAIVNPAITIKAIGHQCESIGTIDVAYNFGPKGRPSNLSKWGIPVGNNHSSSCGTTGLGEDNLLFLLLFLHFRDGGPTVGDSRYKQLDQRDPTLLLFHRGSTRNEKKGML